MRLSRDATTGALLWRLTMKWRAAVERAVTPLGLTHAQYTLLGWLYSHTQRHAEPPSQRQLADYTGLDPVYVSKLVRALERAGFVDRATHPADPRAVQLRLTAEGLDVVHRAVAVVHDLLEELTAPIGGLAGRRNQELMDTLRTLLGDAGDNREDNTMTQPTTTPFGQEIGVASAAGRRILLALLAKDELDFPQWLTMTIVNNEGPRSRDALHTRLTEGLFLESTDAIERLEARGVLRVESAAVELTGAGQARYDRIAALVRDIGAQLLDGVSPDDVATTRRVLHTYTERAAELGTGVGS